jgi:anti-sigma-K factor RskA
VAAAVTYAARYFFGRKWDNIWPDRHFWPVQLSATAALLLLAALATAVAFRLLARRTESPS